MEGRGLPSLPIKKDLNGLSLNGAGDEARLGFAPRSNSLVYEPTVLSSSIFSLSGRRWACSFTTRQKYLPLVRPQNRQTRDILLGKEAFYHWITPAGILSWYMLIIQCQVLIYICFLAIVISNFLREFSMFFMPFLLVKIPHCVIHCVIGLKYT